MKVSHCSKTTFTKIRPRPRFPRVQEIKIFSIELGAQLAIPGGGPPFLKTSAPDVAVSSSTHARSQRLLPPLLFFSTVNFPSARAPRLSPAAPMNVTGRKSFRREALLPAPARVPSGFYSPRRLRFFRLTGASSARFGKNSRRADQLSK